MYLWISITRCTLISDNYLVQQGHVTLSSPPKSILLPCSLSFSSPTDSNSIYEHLFMIVPFIGRGFDSFRCIHKGNTTSFVSHIMGKPKIRSRRKQDKPKAVSSITSQYNFRRRDRRSKSFVQKATSKQKDEPSIKDTGLCSTKTIPGITDIQALTGHGSSGLSKEELLDSFSGGIVIP